MIEKTLLRPHFSQNFGIQRHSQEMYREWSSKKARGKSLHAFFIGFLFYKHQYYKHLEPQTWSKNKQILCTTLSLAFVKYQFLKYGYFMI